MANKAVGFLTFNFGANMGGFNKAMRKAQRSVGRFGKSMKRIGGSMTTNLTMPIVALGAIAIKTFADFEQSMLKVKAVSGATASEFKSLEANAKRLGSSTMFTAKQVAELQLELSKLGLSPEEINKSTDSILSLAQATGHDLAESAKIVASTMNSFGMEASESAKVADMFAAASSNAAIDMEKLGQAMPTVGTTANAVGVPLDELTSMMMTLADSGMEASTMGTHLRKIFVELATKGISFEDAMHKINTSTDKVTTATGLFGKRAFGAGLVLAGNTKKTAEYNSMLDKSAGKSKEMADIMDSGAAGAMRRLKSQAEGVAISLGEMLLPVFEKLMSFIQGALSTWSSLDENTKTIAVSFGLFVAALGPAISLIGSLTTAFAFLLTPIGSVILAIAGIVVAFAFVRENWEAFKERLGDWNWIKNALIQVMQWFIEYNPLSLMLEGFNNILEFFGREQMENPFQNISDSLEDLKVETKEYENEFGSFADAMKNQAKELMGALGVLNNPLGLGGGSGGSGGSGGTEDEGNTFSKTRTKTGGSGSLMGGSFTKANEEIIKTKSFMEMLNDTFGITKESLTDIGTQLGDTLAQGANSFEEFGEQVKSSIKELIGGIIAQGVATAVTNAMSNPLLKINPLLIPVVAGLAAGAAKTAFSSLIPAFADGGIVSGPTVGLMGEYAGAGAGNPEVIAPLNKLKGMMGSGQQNVVVEGRINGNDIWLSNSKTNDQRNRGI